MICSCKTEIARFIDHKWYVLIKYDMCKEREKITKLTDSQYASNWKMKGVSRSNARC